MIFLVNLAKNWRTQETMGSTFGETEIERSNAGVHSEKSEFSLRGQWALIVDHSKGSHLSSEGWISRFWSCRTAPEEIWWLSEGNNTCFLINLDCQF